METQILLNPNLRNPFVLYDLKADEIAAPSRDLVDRMQADFEMGRILVIEGLRPKYLEFFLDMKPAVFSEWVPPVEDHEILQESIDENHPFWRFYPSKEAILEFQKHLLPFQESWEALQRGLFPNYKYKKRYWSWRMNQMDLGYLHLDVPPPYKEHQMRSFMNLSRRARIIEVGPTLESLIAKFYESENLVAFKDLNATDYLQNIKSHLFKKLHLDEHYVPRHALRLAPGAIWISHSSLITHGLVYGEKTVCLETRIPPEQIVHKERLFHNVLERVRMNSTTNVEPLYLHESKERGEFGNNIQK